MRPFEDARTTEFVYKKHLVLEPGANAGTWVANAIKTELERSGANVRLHSKDAVDFDGFQLSGIVNIIQARQTGWSPGGLLGAFTAGLRSQIEVSVELLYHGVPQLDKTYRVNHEFKTDGFANFMVGANPRMEVPQALPQALQELICSQILPDLKEAHSASTSLGGRE